MGKRRAREVWEYDSLSEFEADGGAAAYGIGKVIVDGIDYVSDGKNVMSIRQKPQSVYTGTIIKNFTSLADIALPTIEANSTLSLVIDKTGTGGNAIQIKKDSGPLANNKIDFSCTPFVLENTTTISVLAYVEGHASGSIAMYLSSTIGDFTAYTLQTTSAIAFEGIPIEGAVKLFTIPASLFVPGGTGAVTIGSIINYMRLTFNSFNATGSISIKKVIINAAMKPAIHLSADDGFASQAIKLYPEMVARSLPFSLAVVSSNIDKNASTVTLAQLKEMQKNGVSIANHTVNHKFAATGHGVVGNGGPCNQIGLAQTVTAGNDLLLNGSTGGSNFDSPRHVVINIGINNANKRFIITGEVNGVLTVETLIGLNNIPSWTKTEFTKVISITCPDGAAANTSIGISPNYSEMYAEINGCKQKYIELGLDKALHLGIVVAGQFTGILQRVYRDCGITIARLTSSQYEFPALEHTNYALSGSGGFIATGGAGALIAVKDMAISLRRGAGIYLHDIVDDSVVPLSNQARISDVRILLDSIVASRAAGACDVFDCVDYAEVTKLV